MKSACVYSLIAGVNAFLAALCLISSLSASATFWLNRAGIDPWQTGVELAAISAVAMVLAVSPSCRNAAETALTTAWAWLTRIEKRVRQFEPGGLPPAVWPVLATCRMFLALVVLCLHASYFAPMNVLTKALMSCDGNVAVLLFLFISGFSIAHSAAKEPAGFYKRRFWRIMPVYWACLALAVLPYRYSPGAWSYQHILRLGPVSGWEWAWQAVPLFGITEFQLQSYFPAWSLGVEVVFYALAPLFVRLKTTWLLAAMLVSATASQLLWIDRVPKLDFACVHCLWAWLAGFIYYRHIGKLWVFALPFLPCVLLDQFDLFRYQNPLLFNGVGMSAVFGVIVIAINYARSLPKWLSRFAFTLGDWSYPLYLVHAPMLWIMWITFRELNVSVSILAVFCATVAVYYGVDCPVRKLTRESKEARRTPISVSGVQGQPVVEVQPGGVP